MRAGRIISAALAALLATTGVAAASPDDAPGQQRRAAGLDVYEVEGSLAEVEALRGQGLDVEDLEPVRGARRGTVRAQVITDGQEAALLRGQGLKVGLRRNAQGLTTAEAATLEADNGFEVWRSWSEPGGIEDELELLAAQYPGLVEERVVGQSVQGQDIVALRVTADVDRVKEGRRPAVLYSSLQHAREWITVETNRRLLRHYLENYGSDGRVTDILESTELWFLVVANPDGYDWTFTEGQRLWRKNLRDNDGDGEITTADGVDLNRNFPTNWGYDNEGSSPEPSSQVYRGPSPASEPETQAMDQLLADVDPVFQLNFHSAAELLLYGIGWQVATPSPDDLLHVAVNGTDENPAVAGYDPDISAELYTTNGDTTDHAAEAYGIMSYTPELDTCESAEDIFPDDAFGDDYCETEGRSGFEFPDDEALVQAVFEKNLDYSLSVAESADDPTNPETATTTGLQAPDFRVDDFTVSTGAPQVVAVETKREFRNLRMRYSVDGGRTRTVRPTEWEGGERYGGTNNEYYAEYRGEVTGAEPGDSIEVWFTAVEPSLGRGGPSGGGRQLESAHFTYDLLSDTGAQVLVLANEDYDGFNPVQDVDGPQAVDEHTAALEANGITYDVWDVTAQGVPHDLGVLSHYDAVVWETGDNRLTQEEEDVSTDTPFGPLPDLQVAERQQYLTVAVRDYLNAGGKVFQNGEYVAYFGFFGGPLGGAYYGLNGDETADCVVESDFFGDCLIFSDDFAQYYQGVYGRTAFGAPEVVAGVDTPLDGTSFAVDGAQVPDSGDFSVTSDFLPVEDFPQFASSSAAVYESDAADPFAPLSGEQYAAAQHADGAWMRLSRTVDLTAAATGELAFAVSYDLEPGYDNFLVEVRPVGSEDWTTLPEAGGLTSSAPPSECSAGFYVDQHPELTRYLTVGDPCATTGTSGAWNAMTGSTGGWTQAAFDLSAYAGQEVEVVLSYVTDPGTGGRGVFVDDVAVTVDGTTTEEGFEDGPGEWTVPGAPEGSPGNSVDWVVGGALFEPPSAAVTTEDTVTFGFGFEAIATAEERAEVMGRVLAYLLDGEG